VQTNATSGDAACSKNGILYPASGAYQPISGYNLTHCNGSSSAMTSAGALPTASGAPAWPMGNSSTSTTVVAPMTRTDSVSITGADRSDGVALPSATKGSDAPPTYTGAAAGAFVKVEAGAGVVGVLLAAFAL